jgi:hypothetical protein
MRGVPLISTGALSWFDPAALAKDRVQLHVTGSTVTAAFERDKSGSPETPELDEKSIQMSPAWTMGRPDIQQLVRDLELQAEPASRIAVLGTYT